MNYDNPYIGSYPYLKARKRVWREIVRFVASDVQQIETLIELGAGYCDFINQFPATQKIAFEINPEMATYADKNIDFRLEDAISGIQNIESKSVDLIFASNFLEHLEEAELNQLLPEVVRCLKSDGQMIIIQPNYSLCAKNYFNDPTHKLIMSDKNLESYINPYGLRVVKLIPNVLPFSLKTRLPKWPLLVRLYLASPVKPFGAQMYAILKGV